MFARWKLNKKLDRSLWLEENSVKLGITKKKEREATDDSSTGVVLNGRVIRPKWNPLSSRIRNEWNSVVVVVVVVVVVGECSFFSALRNGTQRRRDWQCGISGILRNQFRGISFPRKKKQNKKGNDSTTTTTITNEKKTQKKITNQRNMEPTITISPTNHRIKKKWTRRNPVKLGKNQGTNEYCLKSIR